MRHARACFCKCTDARITTKHSHCSKPCCSLPCITACICCMREHYTCVQDKHTPSSSSHSLGMYHDSISSNQSTACCMQTSTALACCITPHPSRHSPCTTPQPALEDIQPNDVHYTHTQGMTSNSIVISSNASAFVLHARAAGHQSATAAACHLQKHTPRTHRMQALNAYTNPLQPAARCPRPQTRGIRQMLKQKEEPAFTEAASTHRLLERRPVCRV